MRHGVKKIKVKSGKDANKMLVRKLAKGFLLNGNLTVTLKKAKFLKAVLDNLVAKAKVRSESNKNYLMSKIGDKKLVDKLFDEVGPAVKNIIGGYVRIVKIGVRLSDGSNMARLEWAHPVVKEKPVAPKVTKVTDEEKK